MRQVQYTARCVPTPTSGRGAEVTIGWANVQQIQAATDLVAQHFAELRRHAAVMSLRPEWEVFAALERRGELFCLGAWLGEPGTGRLVGYSATHVRRHLQDRELIYAQSEAIFVLAEFRAGGVGRKLLEETESVARKLGARLLLMHGIRESAAHRFFERCGMHELEVVLSKEL